MAQNKKKAVLAYCTNCDNFHYGSFTKDNKSFQWTGRKGMIPRIYCEKCRNSNFANTSGAGECQDRGKKRRKFLGLVEGRGVTSEYKRKHDIEIEIMSRKQQYKPEHVVKFKFNPAFHNHLITA